MTDTIKRTELFEFFKPLADQAQMASERAHIHMTLPGDVGDDEAEWHHHCAGYVCELREDAVCKYAGGGSVDWLDFNTINRITIHDRIGNQLREYRVV